MKCNSIEKLKTFILGNLKEMGAIDNGKDGADRREICIPVKLGYTPLTWIELPDGAEKVTDNVCKVNGNFEFYRLHNVGILKLSRPSFFGDYGYTKEELISEYYIEFNDDCVAIYQNSGKGYFRQLYYTEYEYQPNRTQLLLTIVKWMTGKVNE